MAPVPAACGRAFQPIRSILSFLVLVILAAAGAHAQDQARLAGRVLDPEGRAVAGASVVVSGATAAPLAATTDADGRFLVEPLARGTYDVTATAPGLAGQAAAVRVAEGGAEVDVRLQVRALTETLVVSASLVDQPLSRTADSVTALTGAELEARQLYTVGAALRSVPGFAVAQNGGPGTLTSLFPRGGESDYTLVLVDGVRANGFGGGVDLSQIPLADVERIEVVRGPQSSIFGSDAIGGVVQVITRQGGRPTLHGVIEGGSRETRRASASTTGAAGAFRWQAGGDYFEDQGFTGIAPASGESVGNDDARHAQGWVGLGWRHARGTDVQGSFRYVETERGAPGAYGSDPANRFSGVDRVSRGDTTRRAASVRLVQPWFGPASRVRQRVEIDVADYDLVFVSRFGTSSSGTARVHGRVQTDAAMSSAFGVSGGVEWLTEEGRSTFITAGPAEVPVERRVIGTFGEARWNGHRRLSVTAGVRAEHVRRAALGANPSLFAPRPAFAEDAVVSVNPKVSASWLLSDRSPSDGARAWTRLRAAAGTGIRPPDAFEIAFTDNPSLKPERSRSLEAGITQALAGGAVQIDATAFFNQYDNLIISVGRNLAGASRFRTDNISNARARGLELGAAFRARTGLDVRATYTFLDAEIRAVDGVPGRAPAPFAVGDALLRRPRHQGSLDVTYTRQRLTVFGALAARGETLDAEPAFGPTGGLFANPGRAVADAGASFRLVRGVEIHGRVLNLFDRAYEEVLGFPAPGRTAFGGVRLALGR